MWSPALTIGGCLREVFLYGFDWEHFSVLDRWLLKGGSRWREAGVVAHWGSTVDQVDCWRLFFGTKQVQEVPSDEFQETGVFLGPILRINCFETVQFSRSMTIQLPLSLRQEKVLLPDPTTCRVRVLFLKSDDQDKEWIEITDDLVKPASFDGKFIRFQVEWLSG